MRECGVSVFHMVFCFVFGSDLSLRVFEYIADM